MVENEKKKKKKNGVEYQAINDNIFHCASYLTLKMSNTTIVVCFVVCWFL